MISGKPYTACVLAGTALYGAAGLYAVQHSGGAVFVTFAIAGMLAVAALYRSLSVFLELSLLILVWLVVGDTDPHVRFALYLTLVTAVILYAFHRTVEGKPAAVAGLLAVFWALAAGMVNMGGGAVPLLLSASVIPGLMIFTRNTLISERPRIRAADLILFTSSGNTAHAALRFAEGMQREGAEVTIHRFRTIRSFRPELRGDALVVAFPVFGWKPPWPLCEYLLGRLPRGEGKSAFVLYTSAGGPENTGMVTWLLLTLRGYRVVGRSWCVYPMNVPTFRLGPARVWKFLDRLAPPEPDLDEIARCGARFASGLRAGVPFILWPFPLVIVGVLFDNRLVNTVLYRNYVWKRRCERCGLCVKMCPTERLRMEEYPEAHGTCALCMTCVNLCPRNAMHLFGWTEYGHPYRPRWPELLKGETMPSERRKL